MASGGDSVDGDGPEKVDGEKLQREYCESPTWTNLPPPIFCKLLSKMRPSFIHLARQVCPTWLSYVDNEIGLSVKIDDTIAGNIEFVQNVKVVQARVVNWRTSNPPPSSSPLPSTSSMNDSIATFLYPACLKKLILAGKMPEQWKIADLQNFPNLSHLVLRGAALHSQDMTGHPLPGPPDTDDFTFVQYQQYEPIQNAPVWLNRLRKLEIIMNEFSYPSVLPLSIRLHDPERAMEHERLLQHLYFVVVNNTTFVLNNIRSPYLTTAQFYIYPKAGISPPKKINWKYLPLQRFLENHQKSIRHLYLPEFEGKHDNTEVDLTGAIPEKLSKFQVTLSRYIGDREESREQSSTYWKRLLTEQTQLVDLDLAILDLSGGWIHDSLSSVAFSSKDTLTYVDLTIQVEEPIQLNLEIFGLCHSLEILKLTGREQDTVVGNFCKLPRSLKKFRINFSLIEMPDPEFIDQFTNLDMLELVTVVVFDQTHNRTVELIKKIFQLRKLNLLSLTFDVPGNTNRQLVNMMRMLDEEYQPIYPNFVLKMNLEYEFESGWGEDRFDEDKNNVEYINTREPEEYSTWHRNAISVDDEDHRILIFQTLPFLLELRGRRSGVEGDDDGDVSDDDDSEDDRSIRESIFEPNDDDMESHDSFAPISRDSFDSPD